MIILSQTTDILEVVLGGAVTANQLRCMASWRDITTSSFAPDRTVILTNGATPINAVGSPGASTQRVVDLLNIYNADTVSQTVTVQFNANGTRYVLISASLAAGESLQYVEGTGWVHLTAAGAVTGVASIAGTANEITASAATGAVTLSLPTALTFTGKTITGGTFASPVLSGTLTGSGTIGGSTIINTSGTITGGAGSFTTLTSSGNYTVGAGFKLTQNTNAYVTPEDNVRGAVLSGTAGAYLMSGGSVILGATSTGVAVTGVLRLGNSYVATPPTCTGYVTLQDSTGTTYKVLVST